MAVEVEDLIGAYEHVVSEAMNTPCSVPPRLIRQLHQELIDALTDAGDDHDVDSSCLHHIHHDPSHLERMSRNFERRKFAFNKNSSSQLYQWSISAPCDVTHGIDNDDVIRDIRSWLCDFGSDTSSTIYGYWRRVGGVLREDELKVRNTIRTLLRNTTLTTREMQEPDLDSNVLYSIVYPIKMELHLHNPAEITGNVRMEHSEQRFRIKGTDEILLVNAPQLRPQGKLKVGCQGDISYYVKKGVYVRKWAKITSLGINAIFDKTFSKKFIHKLELELDLDTHEVKLREKPKIHIERSKADEFHKKLIRYERLALTDSSVPSLLEASSRGTQAIKDNDSENNDAQWCAAGAGIKRWQAQARIDPAADLIRELNLDAIIDIVHKKGEIVAGMDFNDQTLMNNVNGLTFEHVSIARVLAEAKRKNLDLHYIAGDGVGEIQFNGKTIQVPEYVDALYYNPETNTYQAVQYKYSHEPEYLAEMINNWYKKHSNAAPAQELPDFLKLDNVDIMTPAGVHSPKELLDPQVQAQWKKKIDAGFQVDPAEFAAVEEFFKDNYDMMADAIQYIEAEKTIAKGLDDNLKQQNKQGRTLEKLKDAHEKAPPHRKADVMEKIKNTEQSIAELKAAENDFKQQLHETEENLKKHVSDNISPMKRDGKQIARMCGKQVGVAAATGAAVSLGIVLIISCYEEIKRCRAGEITKMECFKQIVKSSALATATGAAMGAMFALPELLAIPEVAAYAAARTGWQVASPICRGIGKAAGPAIMLGILAYSSWNVLKRYNNGDISGNEALRQQSRLLASSGLSVGSMVACGAAIGGLPGLAVGVLAAIIIGIGDHFLGDKFWGLFFKDDPEEMRKDVIDSAYSLLDLTDQATDEELKEALRAAYLKYHPDKAGGDAEIFKAIRSAKTVIENSRNTI
ncbi:hypothetical protein GJAV_G00236280 [Gymnothorax javanicus]|nr:hypothetical protein GJAV_G00236280 [Gymnothorax javanicus]